jgi:hypothetical protein
LDGSIQFSSRIAFGDGFKRWVQGIRGEADGELVAIDRKTLCGSGNRATGKEPRHLVEAWAAEQRLVLGQRRSENGSNEIEAIPQLLEELLLEGCNAWIDAMGCQTDIAEAIQEAQLLCRLMDVNIRLAVPRDSIEDSGEHDPHGCTSHPDPCGA